MTAKSLRYIKWGFVLMFFNINIGRFDLLPNFAGVLLLIMALRSQWEETETEKRLEPLLTALVIDYFLHWIFAFDNGVENLMITIISIYTIYVYLGEVMVRVEDMQPEIAGTLQKVRVGYALLQVLNYVCGAYNMAAIVMIIAIGFLVLLVVMLFALFGIAPNEESEGPSHE